MVVGTGDRGRVGMNAVALACLCLMGPVCPTAAAWFATGVMFSQSGPIPGQSGAFALLDLGVGAAVAAVQGPQGTAWEVAPPWGESTGPRRWDVQLADTTWPLVEFPLGTYTLLQVGSAELAGPLPGTLRWSQGGLPTTLAVGEVATLTWNAPVGALETDAVIVRLRDAADGAVLFSTPGPGEPGVLRASDAQVALTLPPVEQVRVEAVLFRPTGQAGVTEDGAAWQVGAAGMLVLDRTLEPTSGATGPPLLAAVWPPPDSQVDDRRPVVRLTFSEPMWAGADAVVVGPDGGSSTLRMRWTEDRTTMLVGWEDDLPDGTHTVVLNPPGSERRLRNLAGVELAANTVGTSFSVGAASVGPRLIGRSPDREWLWGSMVEWEVLAEGDGLTYQWYRGAPGDRSHPWPNGQAASLDLGPMIADQAGWVEIIDQSDRILSSSLFQAWLRPSPPPVIQSFATHYAAAPGSWVTLAVTASDPDGLPLVVDWFEGQVGDTTHWVGTGAQLEQDALASTQYWARVANPVAATATPAAVVSVDTVSNSAQALQVWLAQAGVPRLQRQPGADPDRDGRANLWEYAMGSDPLQPEWGPLPWTLDRLPGGDLRVEVRTLPLEWPVAIELHVGSQLGGSWQLGPAPAVQQVDGWVLRRWSLAAPAGSEWFGRLAADLVFPE